MAAKKASEGFSKGLMEEVHKWGAMKQTGVSLRYMMEFGSRPTPRNLLISAQFLHKELPIRIARRAIELDSLPYGLSQKPAVLKVRDWYLDSFRDLKSFPHIKDNNDELEFTQMIKMIKVRHNNVVPMMALGVQQLKKDLNRKTDYQDLDEIHQYVPTHLHLMVFELVKNSLRAVQERFVDSDKVAPPIRIIVADGLEDVSDEGGGIPRSGLPRIFTYLYSTAKNPLDEQSNIDLETAATMAGYGYGLPISRLYARYFGGDLQIISMEGYGTDAYLHLSRLGDSQEPLP
ncbi:hypothetical protein DH2020_020139 [Rehmannia glutinosa]|uniref:Protein-serine/threonine kinase n=1 Tax=Rehmannia glutinosa TaxID=99300 RepID=A0ABR0WGK4_REHGL